MKRKPPKRRGPITPLIPELQALRVETHKRLQEAEWNFMKVDRALNAAKRRERDKEVKNDV